MNDMKFDDIVLDYDPSVNGVYGSVTIGDYELSIVKNDMSYGNKQGLYEIGVWKGKDLCELPGITVEGDTVKGWLTEDDVNCIIKKLYLISGGKHEHFSV